MNVPQFEYFIYYFWLNAISNFLNFNNKGVYIFMAVRELFLFNISSKFEILWLWIFLWIRKFMVLNYPMTSFKKSIDFVIQGRVMKQWNTQIAEQ